MDIQSDHISSQQRKKDRLNRAKRVAITPDLFQYLRNVSNLKKDKKRLGKSK